MTHAQESRSGTSTRACRCRIEGGKLASGVALGLLVVGGCRGANRKSSDDAPALTKQVEDIRPGEEREIGGGTFMKIHRIQATDPIGEGWHRATSTEGAFSVELPLAFNDLRIRADSADHVELRSHSVGAKTPGLLAWSATCMVRRDGKLGPEDRAPGADTIERKGTTAFQRTVERDGVSCILIVEAQGTDPLPPAADRDRFLLSLKRTGWPVW